MEGGQLVTYSVRLILHQKDLRPCSDVADPDKFDTALVWLYGPDAGPKADNGPFPCRHGKEAIIRTCTLEVPSANSS